MDYAMADMDYAMALRHWQRRIIMGLIPHNNVAPVMRRWSACQTTCGARDVSEVVRSQVSTSTNAVPQSTEHLARAASRHQQPADRQEPESAGSEEHPVVQRNVVGQAPHVVQVEQVMINCAFGEIEGTPSE
jgi:hypothetical protein